MRYDSTDGSGGEDDSGGDMFGSSSPSSSLGEIDAARGVAGRNDDLDTGTTPAGAIRVLARPAAVAAADGGYGELRYRATFAPIALIEYVITRPSATAPPSQHSPLRNHC